MTYIVSRLLIRVIWRAARKRNREQRMSVAPGLFPPPGYFANYYDYCRTR
jgi:hypothetical protein